MAAMGWSAGGHLTNWLVANHSDRFKAAASGAGGANWFSFYAQTDMHFIREIWFNAPPYDEPELFRAKSPINHIKGAKTPTIIFCGSDDARVPAPQSWEMYIGLRRLGVTTQFRLYPGEPHGLRKISHRRDKMISEMEWLDRFLNSGEDKTIRSN
jgi:dipeptidyl aminopeptidase/acylaminoacyl peptidase